MKATHVAGDLAAYVDPRANADVLAYLDAHAPHCHSDVGEALLAAATTRCGEWIAYSPAFAGLCYVALITEKRIFALAHDMAFICLRLSASSRSIALECGAKPAPEIGIEWARIQLFRPEYPDPDLAFWVLRAYSAAREAAQLTSSNQ
jgi:hypothetical protein